VNPLIFVESSHRDLISADGQRDDVLASELDGDPAGRTGEGSSLAAAKNKASFWGQLRLPGDGRSREGLCAFASVGVKVVGLVASLVRS
jgi:hypothetical protein